MALGKLIGRGNTAEVYEWGENEVIKLFDLQIPESLVDEEYQSNILIQDLQLPSPLVNGKTEIDGKKAIIYEKINGNSLTKQLTRNPFAIRGRAKLFSQLHQQIHKKDGAALPKQILHLLSWRISGTNIINFRRPWKMDHTCHGCPVNWGGSLGWKSGITPGNSQSSKKILFSLKNEPALLMSGRLVSHRLSWYFFSVCMLQLLSGPIQTGLNGSCFKI